MTIKDLPILERAHALYPRRSLEGIALIGCQHFLNSNYYMLESLVSHGLDPQHTHIIGKSYSFNEEVACEIEALGAHVHRYKYDSHVPFDDLLENEIENFLKEKSMLTSIQHSKTIVVLDDGGHIISHANRIRHPHIVGVEQTSSGYARIKGTETIPVVNVARSRAKLLYESPHIADCFLEKLTHYLNMKHLSPTQALILGNGPVGNAVKEKLNMPFDVYDPLTENMVETPPHIEKYDLIIGATGTTSINHTTHCQLKQGTILASVSSSDREFDSVHIRRAVESTDDPHIDYSVNGIHLPNAGFPLTFDGSLRAVPPKHIQLTHALMIAGAYQAMDMNTPGIESLHESSQCELVRALQSEV